MKKTKLFLFLCLIASFVFADDIYHSNNEYFKNNVYFTSSNRPTWNNSGLATTNEIGLSTIIVGTNTLSGDIILTNSGNLTLSVEDNSINIHSEPFKQIQSDWNEKDEGSPAFIINKPTTVGSFSNDVGYVSSNQVETMIFNKIIEMSTVGWKQGDDQYKLVVQIILPSPKTTFTFADGTEEVIDISGTLDRQWMITNGYYNNKWIKNITKANIGTNVTSIGENTFSSCDSLTSVIIPNSVTNIDRYAFYWIDGLENIILPNSITDIKDGTFYNCINLTSVIIPNSVTNIGPSVFFGCGLTNIIIGAGVKSIGEYTFDGCTRLSSITCLAPSAPSIEALSTFGSSVFSYTGRKSYSTGNNTLKIPQGATGYNSSYWNDPLQHQTKCGFHIEYITE